MTISISTTWKKIAMGLNSTLAPALSQLIHTCRDVQTPIKTHPDYHHQYGRSTPSYYNITQHHTITYLI